MTFSNLTFFKIPKRAKECSVSEVVFKAKDEIVSRIKEAKKEYVREDFFAEHETMLREKDIEEEWIYWSSVIPKKEKIDLTPKTKIERAFNLLHQLLSQEEKDEKQEQTLYVLTLFLQRQKQLFLKREHQSKKTDKVSLIFERPENGEVFTLVRPELPHEKINEIQEFIAKTLKGDKLELIMEESNEQDG
jgi:hypothetical protein